MAKAKNGSLPYFRLNVHGFNNARQTEICTGYEALVPELIVLKIRLVLKSWKVIISMY